MSHSRYQTALENGGPVALWELGPVIEADFSGLPAPADDPVQYVFRNGFTGTGHLPCRSAFLTEMKGRAISPPEYWVRDGFYAPLDNPRIEFNGFCYTPRHCRRWLRTTISASQAGDYAFTLSTCGGARIWMNGREIARFEPFERNTQHSCEIQLPLAEGDNEILLHMEDLFERDTNWLVELRYTGTAPLEVGISAQTDPQRIARVRSMAADVRPTRDYFVDEPFVLAFDEAPDFDVPVAVKVVSHQHDRATLLDKELVLKAGQKTLDLGPARDIREGYHWVSLTFHVGDVTISRVIDAAFLRAVKPGAGADTEAKRKAEALAFAAEHGDPRMGRLLALFATGTRDDVAVQAILTATLESIERREDCSDFIMVPLLWAWGMFREDIPARFQQRIRHAVLGWRYWVDEPGNDVMWFWSENHTLCFHVSQYIAGGLFPDDTFTCSGRTGREQQAVAEERLGLWFDAVEEHGFVEWNSAAYYPIDFIGIFGLYQWCDGTLRERCRKLLDKLFIMTGLHTLKGVPAGSQGRAYDKELRAGPLTELAPFARVAFGEGWLNPGVAALPLYCLSDYSAPEEGSRAALWENATGIEARYTQGHDNNGKLVLYKNAGAMLSSVVEHAPGKKGHQQHVVDVRLAGHPMARLWVNHPGEPDPWGVKRPSFWSGNGILPLVNQYRDTALMLYDLGDNPEMDFVHAFAAADGLDELTLDGQWLFARSGDGYAAIWASRPLVAIDAGATAGREFRAKGTRSGFVVRVSSGAGASGFKDFVTASMAATPTISDAHGQIAVRTEDGTELALGWSSGFSINGVATPFETLTPDPQIVWGNTTASGQ
ncbi:hypothetical protein GCM10007989_34800 [Devosia pacifica]|uniref:PA14 domain-containing protein n=1 Tax=Devosia pacifica TaxID=1335967 RepID=A0A918VXZ4_9HYPH|nr:hypothetical protein [Devosia pacifica]GHA35819.1 hypothetical protein GCM10007989_34800 [Devosia pacifica]